MSILARYRKPGGFRQLLQLIETSQPIKQAKLLEVVEKEDPQWANLIRTKKIDASMVLKWDLEYQAMILENMVAQHAVVILKNSGDEKIKEFRTLLKLEKYRELDSLLTHMDPPKESALQAAQNHMLETVRYLDEEKKIILRFIDPSLDLSEAA